MFLRKKCGNITRKARITKKIDLPVKNENTLVVKKKKKKDVDDIKIETLDENNLIKNELQYD